MNCTIASFVGLGFLGASFATLSVSKEQTNFLRNKIHPEIAEIYENIVKERREHYFQGLLLGLFFSYFSLHLLKTSNLFFKITYSLMVTIATSVLYYFIMPKSDYMLNHLKTKEENQAWLQVYNTMKQRYISGFLLGSAAAIPLSYALC